MSISRRGFLRTLAAAAGAAAFDPVTKLWSPAPAKLFVPGGDILLTQHVTRAEFERAFPPANRVIEQMLELDELALEFAKAMGDRLSRSKAVALREVMYRATGNVHLPAGILEIEGDEGLGRFESPHHRTLGNFYGTAHRRDIAAVADEYHRSCAFSVYAPISRELRPGEPFGGKVDVEDWDLLVGVATDPESGLSARALKVKLDSGKRVKVMTHFEMAGGFWRRWKPREATTGHSYYDLTGDSGWDNQAAFAGVETQGEIDYDEEN